MLPSSCCPHPECPISLKAVRYMEKSTVPRFEPEGLSHGGHSSKTCASVVLPEIRKDFVQGKPEKLLVPGFYQGGLILTVARAEEGGEPYASELHYSSPRWTRNSMCAPEHMEMNRSRFGRSTATYNRGRLGCVKHSLLTFYLGCWTHFPTASQLASGCLLPSHLQDHDLSSPLPWG